MTRARATTATGQKRVIKVERRVKAGCCTCDVTGGPQAGKVWECTGAAARHHDATGHRTWMQVVTEVTYPESEQPMLKRLIGRKRTRVQGKGGDDAARPKTVRELEKGLGRLVGRRKSR